MIHKNKTEFRQVAGLFSDKRVHDTHSTHADRVSEACPSSRALSFSRFAAQLSCDFTDLFDTRRPDRMA